MPGWDLEEAAAGVVARISAPSDPTESSCGNGKPVRRRRRRMRTWSPEPTIVVGREEHVRDDSSEPGRLVSRAVASALCFLILIVMALLAFHSILAERDPMKPQGWPPHSRKAASQPDDLHLGADHFRLPTGLWVAKHRRLTYSSAA